MGTCKHARVLIRGRTEDDLSGCELLARASHDLDGYPVHMPDDMRKFLIAPDELAAWVAEVDGEVAGHVSLHARCSPGAIKVASRASGVKEDGFGVVARLLVSPAARRRGIGRGLLDTARTEATDRGLVPMLEVVAWHEPAVSLYEALGWSRVGQSRDPFARRLGPGRLRLHLPGVVIHRCRPRQLWSVRAARFRRVFGHHQRPARARELGSDARTPVHRVAGPLQPR